MANPMNETIPATGLRAGTRANRNRGHQNNPGLKAAIFGVFCVITVFAALGLLY